MSEVDYHLLAILPPDDFSIDRAIQRLSGDHYEVRAQAGPHGIGIRLELKNDGWGLVAWLENDDESRTLIQELSVGQLPANLTADQISSCDSYLSIWSDDDSDFMNTAQFEEMAEFIASKLGTFVYDNRLGDWRNFAG